MEPTTEEGKLHQSVTRRIAELQKKLYSGNYPHDLNELNDLIQLVLDGVPGSRSDKLSIRYALSPDRWFHPC